MPPLARKKAIAEQLLVQDMAEVVADHGFKVVRHQVSVDHERDETRLTVQFVKANPDQAVLKLTPAKKGSEEDDS